MSAGERRVKGIAHRVVNAADVERDVVIEMPDVRRGHRDVLGEASVAVHADDAREGADVCIAGAAQKTSTIDDVSLGRHAIARSHVRHELSDLYHIASEIRGRPRSAASHDRAPSRPTHRCARRFRTRRRVVLESIPHHHES
jgi:hypothetical protein